MIFALVGTPVVTQSGVHTTALNQWASMIVYSPLTSSSHLLFYFYLLHIDYTFLCYNIEYNMRYWYFMFTFDYI